jgi:predicted Zn-dependent protease
MRRIRFSGTLALAALSACATNPATGKREFSLVSQDDEVAIGQQEAQQVTASMTVLQQQRVQDDEQAAGCVVRPRRRERHLANRGAVRGIAQQGLGILMLKYSRDDETQADGLGYRYMLKANWDPREAVKMFQMLQKTSGTDKEGQPPAWMSTYPDPGDRAQRASARLKELANTNLDSVRRDREQFLRAIDGLSYGEDPREGFFRGSTFYQPDLALQITFPDGWQTANQPQVVAAREPEGKALVQVQAAKGANPTEAARAFFSNQGLSNVREAQIPTTGVPSVSAVFAAQTQQGVVEGETTFLTVKGHMYQVLTVAAQGNLQAVDAIHRKVIASAKETTDPAILNIRAPQVKVVQLPRAMTVEQFYSQFPSVLPLDQVLIVNGLEPGAQLKQGDLVKQVVAGTR